MYGNENEAKKVELLKNAISRIEANCRNENRSPLPVERDLLNEMRSQVDVVERSMPNAPLSQPGSDLGGGNQAFSANRSAGKSRSWAGMFNLNRGGLDTGGFKDANEFLNVLESGRYDPRLQILNASMGETVPSDGGFAVPQQFVAEWLDASLPNEIARNYARVYPMTSNEMLIPGWDAKDFSSGEFAGLKMDFHAEGATATAQTAKMRRVQLTANMGAIYVDASIELVNDGTGFADQLRSALVKSIGYGIDRFCIGSAGTGAGCPQSIVNSACKLEIDGETGQAGSTVTYGNIKSIFSRQLNPQSAVWLVNAATIPSLLELSIAIGTSGSHVPVMNDADGSLTMLSRPVIVTSHVPTIGSAGCVAFVDFDFYALGMRQEVILDTSDAPRWNQRERSFRVLIRFDAQNTLDAAVTPENGETLSPIVTLAAI
jgi:HK97 family phage major capsid protein